MTENLEPQTTEQKILGELEQIRKKIGSVIALMWFALLISIVGGLILILVSL